MQRSRRSSVRQWLRTVPLYPQAWSAHVGWPRWVPYTHLVTGYPRTGTSMMMEALVAGGITPYRDIGQRQMNVNHGDADYLPNRRYFEPKKTDYNDSDFPARHKGKCIKTLWGAVAKLHPQPYRVILMMRDPEEIRQSYEAAFGVDLGVTSYDYYREMTTLARQMGERGDMLVTMFWYRDVVANPLPHFQLLAERGYPIDPVKAAEVPQREEVRFRIEDIYERGTVGI